MSEVRSEAPFDSELNEGFWREWIEQRESEAQARDEAIAKEFWQKTQNENQ